MGGQSKTSAVEGLGLTRWMRRTLKECSRAAEGLDPDPVHDLRVALRHCISIAEGLMEFDPDPGWKQLKRAAKHLLKRLGALRDCQVLLNWLARPELAGGEISEVLEASLQQEETQRKSEALKALHHFNRHKWRAWEKHLAVRADGVSWDALALEYLVLEQWQKAHELDHFASHSKSRVAYHRLRLGLKRFRYTVECFLPALYQEWRAELKEFQDALGEVHDLDMLRARVIGLKAPADEAARTNCLEKIKSEQTERLERYAAKTHGQDSVWRAWRAKLPSGERLDEAALAHLAAWAATRTPDFARLRRVAEISLKLYDVLAALGFAAGLSTARPRVILRAAALVEESGRSQGKKSYHKSSYRLVRKLRLPVGWQPGDLQLAALLARYHRKALPQEKHKEFRMLAGAVRRTTIFLAGVLRLANCFSEAAPAPLRNLELEVTLDALVIRAYGLAAEEPLASRLATAKHLLEIACGRPILILPGSAGAPLREARAQAKAATSAA